MSTASPSRAPSAFSARVSPLLLPLGLAWALVIAGVTTLVVVLGRDSAVSQIVSNLGFLLALLFGSALCARAAWPKSPVRRGWGLMSLATLAGAISQSGYVIDAFTRTPQREGTADLIAVLGYSIPTLAALVAFPIPPDPLISRFRRVMDVLVITSATILISEATVLRSVAATTDESSFRGLLAFGYPITDIAFCAFVLCLGMRQLPGDRLTWLVLGSGLVILAVSDSIYARMLAEGQQHLTATALVAGWMTAPVLIGLATLIPMTSHVGTGPDLTLAVQLVPYVPVLGALVVLGLGGATRDAFLLIGGIILVVLVTVRQVMIVWENVTLTKDLEAKVAARTAQLTTLGSIVTSSSDAIVGISLDAEVTAWNPAAERLYGHSAEDVVGGQLEFLPARAADVVQGLLTSAQNGEQLSSFEADWQRPDGSSVPVAMTVSPIVDGTGVKGISVSGQDITERRRAAAALEKAREEALESSRLKSEFLATMSHEIRTPMNGVIGLTSLLLETELDEVQRQYADGVRGAGEALLSVINDILDFSKLEAGKVILDPVPFNPRRLVEDVGALLAPAASAKRLELIAYCLPEVPNGVIGDPGRIRQILLNLASNAVKFTSEGEVAVKVKRVRGDDRRVRIRFEISDTGIGIAEKDQHRLFQSFSQADASTTRRFGGTGLGLAISRRLVEVMGGDIGMESEVGVGSLFWFEIDLPATDRVADEPGELRPDLLAGLRALVVDDNATNRTILEAQLTSWRMRPDMVSNARSALDWLASASAAGEPFDLAILDMQMPDIDGLQLAEMISARPATAGLPMVMLTSSLQPDRQSLHAAGIGQWLTKPVKSSELYDRLMRLMAPRELEVAARRTKVNDAVEARRADKGRVLVVEDNALNQMVAEGLVSRLGYSQDSVANGAEALAALATTSYCAVLMDCHMPVMDGFTATREIRARERAAARAPMPVIAMTAGALSEDRERCLEAGMDDYVPKPVEFPALAAVLEKWVGAALPPFEDVQQDSNRVAEGRADNADLTLRLLDGIPNEREGDVAEMAEQPDEDDVIERDRLADLMELEAPDGSSLLATMVDAYRRRSIERAATLRAAVVSGNRDEVAAAAHELKGAAGTIGASHVAEVCRTLELAARGNGPLPIEMLDDLDREVVRANEALLRLDASVS